MRDKTKKLEGFIMKKSAIGMAIGGAIGVLTLIGVCILNKEDATYAKLPEGEMGCNDDFDDSESVEYDVIVESNENVEA